MAFIDNLLEQVKRHEGLRLEMYHCTEGFPTIGYGHNLHVPISENVAEIMLIEDLKIVFQELDYHVPWWEDLPEDAQLVLCNMCFNLGWPKYSQFKKFWAALEDRDYKKASEEMLDSRWANQVKGRATELSKLMLECDDNQG